MPGCEVVVTVPEQHSKKDHGDRHVKGYKKFVHSMTERCDGMRA